METAVRLLSPGRQGKTALKVIAIMISFAFLSQGNLFAADQSQQQPPASAKAQAVKSAETRAKALAQERKRALRDSQHAQVMRLNSAALAKIKITAKKPARVISTSLHFVPAVATGSVDLPANPAKIESASPLPIMVGQELTLLGVHLGTKKTASLHVAGLWVSAPVVTWRDTSVVVKIPEGLVDAVGSETRDATIHLHAEKNDAAFPFQIAPDPSRIDPSITSLSENRLKPGQILFINGKSFQASGGHVYFNDKQSGVTVTGVVDSWADTVIAVHLDEDLEGFRFNTRFYITVENTRNAKSNEFSLILEPNLDSETLFDVPPCKESAGDGYVRSFWDTRLLNGWQVVSASVEAHGTGCECSYSSGHPGKPQKTSAYPKSVIYIKKKSGEEDCCCYNYVEIQGPRGVTRY